MSMERDDRFLFGLAAESFLNSRRRTETDRVANARRDHAVSLSTTCPVRGELQAGAWQR